MPDAGFKYGLLALDETSRPDQDFKIFEGRTVQTFTSAEAIVDAEELEHWRKTIGSLQWDATIATKQRLLVERMASDRPSVLDGENQALANRLGRAWLAWIIPPPNRPWSFRPWWVTGEAGDDAPNGPLKSVRNFGRFQEVTRPFYASLDIYHDRSTRPRNLQDEPTFDTWRRFDDLLAQKRPRILNVAIGALGEALARTPLESRIPEFVRATECIIALPRGGGGGAPGFAARSLRLIPVLASDWFVGPGVHKRLLDLYQHRSDCVHGKIPFEVLHAAGVGGTEEAARFEYLAERLARESIAFALERPGLWQYFEARDLLEDAWQSGAIP